MSSDCVFCKIVAGQIPSMKVYEDEACLAFLDIGPLADGHALLIPPRRPHEVTMHGRVEMLTAYVSPAAWRQVARADCRVVRVSRLLDAALEALGGEPLLYDRRGRGGRLAAIVLDARCITRVHRRGVDRTRAARSAEAANANGRPEAAVHACRRCAISSRVRTSCRRPRALRPAPAQVQASLR